MFTDGSEYSFKTPNPVTSIEVTNERYELDDNSDPVYLPYYVGTNPKLDITVEATFATGEKREVENYTIDGFDLSAPGNVDVTVNFGAASANLQVEAINISDEIAAALAIDGITDPVPGLSAGAQDFVFSAYYQELMIVQEENVAMADALAQYKADLLAANYTLVYESEEGMHFISENKQLYLNVVNYYDIAIDVVINDVRMDAPATTDSVMCKVLQGLFGDQYGWEDFIQNEIPKPQENDGWYFFTKYSTSGSQANFARYIAAFEYYYMPSYMVPTCDAFELVYEDAPSIERDYMSPDGKVALRAIFNLWGTNLYLDIFTSYIA